MKTLKIFVLALCATFMLAACGGGSPEAVAENYVDAALSLDFEKAAKCSSKEHAADILEGIDDYTEEELEEEVKQAKKNFEGITYKITAVEADETEATVKLEFTKGDKTKDGRLELIKEDGKWKVDDERLRLYF